MACPPGASARRIAGAISNSTLEMMFARITCTGATSGSSTPASPRISVTCASTPLRCTFSSALPSASGSSSIAIALRAPSRTAAIASTALPAPRSATTSPARTMSCMSVITLRVVSCSPVPNAIAGSITTAHSASAISAASHGGATATRPSRCMPTRVFHVADQSASASSVRSIAPPPAACTARSSASKSESPVRCVTSSPSPS